MSFLTDNMYKHYMNNSKHGCYMASEIQGKWHKVQISQTPFLSKKKKKCEISMKLEPPIKIKPKATTTKQKHSN